VLGAFFPVRSASAQASNGPEGVAVGEWWFRPLLQLRTRGEYRSNPAEVPSEETAVLAPIDATAPPVQRQWLVHERSRLGLAVDKGPLSASLVIQDARLWGTPSPALVGRADDLPSTTIHTAFFDVHTAETPASFVRLGRQEVSWGEGRLLGTSDWSPTPRALDALRARVVWRAFDVEALAAVLAPPGAVPPEYARGVDADGTGAQLYGLEVTGHFDPLLRAELVGLARIARFPLPPTLVPGDTYVLSARLSGGPAAFSYGLEGAYELGRVGVPGSSRKLRSFAATAHVEWQPDLLFRPKIGLASSYARGDDGGSHGALHRFDPILPDNRSGLGQMGLYAWTNIFDLAALAQLAPVEQLVVSADYRYVRLANPRGAWFAASLAPIGQDESEGAPFLGHEIDASIAYLPYPQLSLRAGYGVFLTGPKARAILRSAARPAPDALHAVFLQATLDVP
jgi:hypothetical protein